MRHVKLVLPVAGGLALLLTLSVAAEDLTVVSKVTGPGTNATATTYMASGKYRRAEGDHDTIMDLSSGRMLMIDHKKKQYWEVTLEEMNAASQQAAEQMKRMSEQMKQNPMAEKLMGRMMGGDAAAVVTVQKGTTPRKIAGYDCDSYVLSLGDAMKVEMWTTAAVQPPAAMFDARKAFTAGNPMGPRFDKLYEEMKKIKGYPLAETTRIGIMGKSTQTTVEATEVKKGAIPASVFALPAGYAKVDSPYKAMQQKMVK